MVTKYGERELFTYAPILGGTVPRAKLFGTPTYCTYCLMSD